MFGHRNGFEWFGHFSGGPGGYQNPPGSIWALLGLSGIEEREGKRGRRAPQAQSELGGGRPPFPSSLSPPSFLSYSYLEGLLLLLGKGGILLPKGVGLPQGTS